MCLELIHERQVSRRHKVPAVPNSSWCLLAGSLLVYLMKVPICYLKSLFLYALSIKEKKEAETRAADSRSWGGNEDPRS